MSTEHKYRYEAWVAYLGAGVIRGRTPLFALKQACRNVGLKKGRPE